MGRGEKVFLKELIVVYIKKGLTLGYTAQALNLFYSHTLNMNKLMINNISIPAR